MYFLLALAVSLPPDSHFEPFHQAGDVKITIARKPDPLPWVRGAGTVPGVLKDVVRILSDVGNYRVLFAEFIETSTVVRREEHSVRVHLVWPFPIFFRDRDAVVTYEPRTEGNRFLLTWKRSEEQGDPSDGRRIDRVEGQTVAVTDEGATQLTYTYYGDLGGDFSEGTKDSAYRKEPLKYFEALRKALTGKAK